MQYLKTIIKTETIMKKYFICLILAVTISQASQAQSLDKLLKEVSHTESVDKVTIGGFLMKLGLAYADMGDNGIAKGINSLEVYDLSNCSAKTKSQIVAKVNQLQDKDGYETLIMTKDKNDNVRIMAKKKKNIISDLVIICVDEADPTIIKFSGKIKEQDIAELVSTYDK